MCFFRKTIRRKSWKSANPAGSPEKWPSTDNWCLSLCLSELLQEYTTSHLLSPGLELKKAEKNKV